MSFAPPKNIRDRMFKNRCTRLPRPATGLAPDQIEACLATGLVVEAGTASALSFNHQTLIDYLVACDVIGAGQSLADFVLEHGQNLFIRPVLRHLLAFKRTQSPAALAEELLDVFLREAGRGHIGFQPSQEAIRAHVKYGIISEMASWHDPSPEEAELLTRLFREAPDRGRLIFQFFNSHPDPQWEPHLRQRFLLPAVQGSQQSVEYRVALGFLPNAAALDPEASLEMGRTVLQRGPNNTSQWYFFQMSDALSKIDLPEHTATKYVEFVERGVGAGFLPWGFEVSKLCKFIASYSPAQSVRLFLSAAEAEAEGQSAGRSHGVIRKHEEVLDAAYELDAEGTLLAVSGFFEKLFRAVGSGESGLRDFPHLLLYSELGDGSELERMYSWLRRHAQDFCGRPESDVCRVVRALEGSSWDTQRHLAFHCMLGKPGEFAERIHRLASDILARAPQEAFPAASEILLDVLEKGFASLSDQARSEIIDRLVSLSPQEHSDAYHWAWAPLNSIPPDLRTEPVCRKMDWLANTYRFQHPYWRHPFISFGGGGFVQPKMRAEELKHMTPEELYQYLVSERQAGKQHEERGGVTYGGYQQLAPEAGRVFADNLERYKAEIEKLVEITDNHVYVCTLLTELSQRRPQEPPPDWFIDLLIRLLQNEVALRSVLNYLERVIPVFTAPQVCRLRPMLCAKVGTSDPERDTFLDQSGKGEKDRALTAGINSNRGLLAGVLLSVASMSGDDDVDSALHQLASDKTISVRAALVFYLRLALQRRGWDWCFDFFAHAFQRGPEHYPSVILSFLSYCHKDKVAALGATLSAMRAKAQSSLGRVYVSLKCLHFLRGVVSDLDLLNILKDSEMPDQNKAEGFGILVRHVQYPETVDRVLGVLKPLVDEQRVPIDDLRLLLLQAKGSDLPRIEPVISVLLRTPAHRRALTYHTLQYLEQGLLAHAPRAFDLLKRIISSLDEDMKHPEADSMVKESKAPLSIINTILQCYPDREDEALDTLDRLISLGWRGVDDYLRSFDRL